MLTLRSMSMLKDYNVDYYKNGSKRVEAYLVNGKYHREDGPAIIWYDEDGNIKYEEYFINGKRHRIDGPAYISYDKKNITFSAYYLNGDIYEDMFKYAVMVGSLKEV